MTIDDILNPGTDALVSPTARLAAYEAQLIRIDREIAKTEAAQAESAPLPVRSSWIQAAQARGGFLAVYHRDGHADLYGCQSAPVPEWMAEVIAAIGGRAVRRMVRGRYPHQRIEAGQVGELRATMRRLP